MLARKMMVASGEKRILYTDADDYVSAWEASPDGTLVRLASFQNNYSNSYGIQVDSAGKYAYTLSYDADRLQVLDVSDLDSITEAGTYTNSTYLNEPTNLWLDEATETVYVGGNYRLTALDVSDPGSISRGTSSSTYENCKRVLGDKANGLLFFANEDIGVYSFTMSSGSFSNVGDELSYSYYNYLADMALDPVNQVLVVTDYSDDRITILTYDGSGTLTRANTFKHAGNYNYAYGVACDPERELAFVSVDRGGSDRGIVVIDYSTPSSPVEVSFKSHDATDGSTVHAIFYDAEWKILWCSVRDSDSILAIDASDETDLVTLARTQDSTYLNSISCAVATAGGGG